MYIRNEDEPKGPWESQQTLAIPTLGRLTKEEDTGSKPTLNRHHEFETRQAMSQEKERKRKDNNTIPPNKSINQTNRIHSREYNDKQIQS